MTLYGRKPIGTVAFMGGVFAVPTQFARCWGKMLAHSLEWVCETNETIHVTDATVSFHSWARNGLVNEFVGDWLLMLDTDHSFEPDLLERMLNRMRTYDLDVLTGLYLFKTPPHSPVLYGWHTPEGATDKRLVALASWDGVTDLFEVAGGGGGCLLVSRRAYDRVASELGEKPFDFLGQSGEDLSFFQRLDKLGIKAYCDPRIECHHLQVRELSLADYDPAALPATKVRIADAVAPSAKPSQQLVGIV